MPVPARSARPILRPYYYLLCLGYHYYHG
jgi:hypothetical protein